MASLWARYVKLLDTKPLLTKSITSGVLVGGGDMIAQVFVEKNKSYDFARTARFLTFGTVVVGPLMHGKYIKKKKNFITGLYIFFDFGEKRKKKQIFIYLNRCK